MRECIFCQGKASTREDVWAPGQGLAGKLGLEALANIKEADELCLECQCDEGWTIPEEYYLEQVEVAIA